MNACKLLWVVWFAWGVWLVNAIYPVSAATAALPCLFAGGVLVLFLFQYQMLSECFMKLFKRGNKAVIRTENENRVLKAEGVVSAMTGEEHQDEDAMSENFPQGVSRKNTFIAQGVQLSGELEGQGNMVIEGMIEGNIRGTHQVRVETGGRVKGDIRAQHIVVNGSTEGRLYADAITLQAEGRIQGEIFTDSLVIEKGGVFTGQSALNTAPPLKENSGNIAGFARPASGEKEAPVSTSLPAEPSVKVTREKTLNKS